MADVLLAAMILGPLALTYFLKSNAALPAKAINFFIIYSPPFCLLIDWLYLTKKGGFLRRRPLQI